MNKAHVPINWENYPSDETPLNERNLNKMDSAIGIIDDNVVTLDATKATKTEVATLVADVTFEESTGIITITKKNGSKITIDTQMEKIAINFDYNPTTQQRLFRRDTIAKNIPNELNITIDKALIMNPELRSMYESDETVAAPL